MRLERVAGPDIQRAFPTPGHLERDFLCWVTGRAGITECVWILALQQLRASCYHSQPWLLCLQRDIIGLATLEEVGGLEVERQVRCYQVVKAPLGDARAVVAAWTWTSAPSALSWQTLSCKGGQ